MGRWTATGNVLVKKSAKFLNFACQQKEAEGELSLANAIT
jgi:hypothetical protein